MLGLVESGLEACLWYLTFLRPVVTGAQLCKQNEPRPTEVTNCTMALIFGWLLEAADRLFLSSFIAMRWVYLIMRIVVCLYLQHPKLLGANKVYETAFAGLVDRYGPTVHSLVLQHMERISEMGLVQYATNAGLYLVRALSSVMEMGKALIDTSTTTNVEPAPLPRRLSQEREAGNSKEVAPPTREPLVTVSYTESAETTAKAAAPRGRGPLPPRSPPPPPRVEDSDSNSDDVLAPFATVRPARAADSRATRPLSSQYSAASDEL